MIGHNQQPPPDEGRIAELEAMLLNGQHDQLDDPLAIHDQLCQLLSAHPTRLLPALERATRSLVDDHRYTNDPRHLRLWLSYAKHVRQPLQVFAFLAERGVGKLLAAFYEEWAWCVKRQGGTGEEVAKILRAGVDGKAQPLERLKRTLSELTCSDSHSGLSGRPSWSMAGQSVNTSWTQQQRANMVRIEVCRYDKDLLCNGQISFEEARARLYNVASGNAQRALSNTMDNITADEDDDDDDIEDMAQPVNPEDLTHISVYKDTTMEAREMAKMLKTATSCNSANTANNSTSSTITHQEQSQPTPKVMMLNEGLARSFPIPENILRVKGNCPNLTVGTSDRTVAPITIGAKKYYCERQLGSRTFLAVDLSADADKDARVVLRRVDGRELAIWSRCSPDILPTLLDAVAFNDGVVVMVVKYYELGSLEQLVQLYDKKHQPMDNRVVLFYTRHLLHILVQLARSHWIANGITLDRLLIGSGADPLDTTYYADGRGGWSTRGMVLAALPTALPADHHYITPRSPDHPVSHAHLDWQPVQSCLLHMLHCDDPAHLSPQWQQLFLVLSNPHGSVESLTACIQQIDALLAGASNPTLKALLVRQEMMIMSQQ